MTITFYITESTREDKKVKIKVRLRDGRDVNLYGVTEKKILPENWDKKNHRIKPDSIFRDKQAYKDYLRDLEDYIEVNYQRDRKVGKIGNKWLSQAILAYGEEVNGKQDDPKTLFEFIRHFIDEAPKRKNPKTSKSVCYKQTREYERAFYYLKELCKEEGREYDFEDINLDFYNRWVEHMEGEGLALNTIGKKIQTLKIFLNDATLKGYPVNKEYKSQYFKNLTEESDQIYLNTDELDAMYKLNLPNKPGQERVRDQFLVAAWTGCRFEDIQQVTQKNINEKGFIYISQGKTGTKLWVPMYPVVKEILEKYNFEMPPLITNQKFNEYLKKIAKKAKINSPVHKQITKGGITRSTEYEKWQLVSAHTARRSFATNLYKDGVPSITIMQNTGHKTEAAFLKYIKVTPEEHAEILMAHWEKKAGHLKVVS